MKYRILAIFLICCLSTAFAAETYGPISKQDTLWSIASRVRTSNAVSIQQVMLALKNKNPQAFTNGNINALREGAYLTVPSLLEIRRLSRVEAMRVTRRQNIAWRTHKTAPSTSSVSTTRNNRQAAQIQRIQSENQQLRKRVALLNEQLNVAYTESRQLAEKLKKAQIAQANSPTTSGISIEVARRVQKLTADINTLKEAVEEKDNYISNLRNKLKSASETIKRQQNDNQRIFAELKASQAMQGNANMLSDPSTQPVVPVLRLSAVNATEEQETSEASAVPETPTTDLVIDTTSKAPSNNINMQPTNDVRLNQTLPLSNTLKQSSDLTVTPKTDASPVTEWHIPAPSNVSLVVALLAVLLIGGLLWFRLKKHRKNKNNDLPLSG